jgi:hypothetical protein
MTKWKITHDAFERWVVVEPTGHEWTFGKRHWQAALHFAFQQASLAISEVP